MAIEEILNAADREEVYLYLEGDKLKYKSRVGGLSHELRARISEHREKIIDYLKGMAAASEQSIFHAPDIRKAADRQCLPMSYAQQRLWFLDQLDGGSAHYNMPGAIRLNGALDVVAVREALRILVERHDILRTRFASDGDGVFQRVSDMPALPLREVDLCSMEPAAKERDVVRLLGEHASAIFDLTQAPLFQVLLIALSPDEHLLAFSFHHIIFDAWSYSIVVREFSQLYRASSAGAGNPLEPLDIQYADFALWQREWLSGDVLQRHADYWKTRMEGAPPLHGLPLDRPRPAQQSFVGALYRHSLDRELTGRIGALCQRYGVTMFMLLETAFAVLIGRYGNENDVVIGSPIAGRTRKDTENLIGLFVNTLALRTQFDSAESFESLLKRNRQVIVDAFTYQHLPFENLVEALQPERSLSYNPIFQIAFSFQSRVSEEVTLPGLTLARLDAPTTTAKFDIDLVALEVNDELALTWTFNTDLFSVNTVGRLGSCLERLLQGMVADPSMPIAALPLATDTDLHLLSRWAQGRAPDSAVDQPIHRLVSMHAVAVPEKIALRFGSEALSYAELDRRTNQLARFLLERGIGRNGSVGLCMERSVDMVIAMLGTLKAGAAYVPIDPNNPSERIAYMAGDAGVGMLLTHASILSELTFDGLHVQAMDDVVFHLQLGSYADTELTVESSPWDLANIIYTSGSTGRPKGVLVTHIGVTRLLVNPGFIELNRDTVMLQICSCSFDMSTFEIWGALLNGGTLVLYPSRYVDNVSINEQIIEHDINTIVFPTSLFDPWSFEAQPQSTIKWIVVAGDILNPHAVNRVYGADDRLTIVNGYGPTENTMLTTYYVVPREFSLDRSLPIGASVNGTFNYVLSPAMQQMPPGAVGELYTGGIGVARGYINQAALTSEKFVVNPFGAEPSVLYKTGDLVRYLPDGNLEYLGRRDNQVKIRGYRIELGDVVAALNLQAGVVESIAIVYGQHSGKRIVGYLVAPDVADEAAFLATVKAGMRQLVPEYMVPEILIRLQRLPLSPNGKVDKRALPDPGEHADTSSYVAPSSLLEQQIAEVWIEVLGREQVSAHANFFEIGGHSLRAVQVVTRLRQLFGVDVGVRTLFEQPTVAGLASAIVSAKKTGPSNIARAPRDRPLPLSWAQQRLWFLDRLDKSAGYAYRIPVGLRLRGKLDRAALRAALDRIVQRHESLRTSFPLLDGQPVQAVASPEIGFALLEHDLSDLPSSSQEAAILEYGAAETRRPFDLAHGPVARGQLLRLADHDHILHVTQHHIVSDAWSLGVLVREVVALYSAFAAKQPDPLPPLSIQYGDYAAWQREWLSGDALDKQIEFWRQHLGGAPALLELPTDRPRPPVQSFAGGTYSFMLPADLVQGLHELSQRHETTLFMTLLSAWAVLLGRLSGQSDVVIGTPVANRQHVDVEPLIGFFVNTLALRVRLEDGSDTAALLARVKQDFLEAYNYQDVPFEQIVEALQPQRNLSHSPVFQVMLSLDNTPRQQALALPDMVVEPVAAATATAHFDLSLSLSGSGDALAANLDYASDLFDAGTIERWAGHFQMLLRAMVRDDHCQIAAMPLIDESESRQLLAFSQGAIGGTRDVYLHQLFEEQVHLRANALALVGEEGQLSYTALNERANRIAHYLLAQGLRTGDRVAVCLRGSLDLVAALLGVLKAGAVYVPLDPIYPRDRLTYMLQDSGAAFLLAHAAGLDGFSALASTVSILALDTAELASLPAHNPELMAPGLTHDHVAYIIYTSGSTGTPKAVMNHHAGVSNFAQVSVEAFGVVHDSQVLQAASCAFDASLLEINMALCAGATLHMAPRESLLPGAPLLETMRSHRITHAFLTPSALAALPVDAELPALHTIVVGGEAIQAGLATQWLRRCRLINAYGPTEAAIASTLFDCSLPWQGNVPIGRPIANARVHILDSQMQPVPVGMAGELYIGGIGVAHGYLHRDNLTRERFVADPFDIDVDAHLYRTGDVGRWRPDGFIEYLGRNDFQVKIRGFRIEAGEIEVLLATVPGVRQAVVAAREDRPGDKRLVAYIVLTDEAHFEVGELRTRLAHDLPEYMIPSAFVRMDGLPLSASGKIDLRALPAPDADAVARQEYEAPVGEVECCIADIWTELLGASPISRHDQFFELGGHSLLAVHFVSRLRDRLGVDLPLRMLFQQPTLATLAASVSKSTASAALVPDSRIPAGCAVITPDMLTLATLEQDEINQIVAGVPGGAACIQDIYPLSPLQKGILFHHLLDETDDPYLLRTVLLIRDEAHLRAILSALQQVIARHDILRSSFHWDGLRDPMQVVHRQASLRVTKLQAATSEIAMDRLREVTEAHDLSMDLRQSPLIVAYTLEMADSGEHLLGIVNHHLIADHVALQLVMGEVALLLEGKGELLPEPVPYKNFIYQASAVSEAEHQAYFSRLLADVEDTTAPFGVLDGHRSEVMRQLGVALDPELSSRVRQCVRQLGVGAAVLLHAAWSLVVAKCVGRDDIVFGTVLLGRLGGIQNAERVVGMFINTLPVRVRIGHANARELVFALQKQLSELLEHEQASLALAQRCSTLPASTPLFTTLFNYRHSSHGQTNVEEVIRGHRVVELKERTNYPIELDVDDYGTAFGITLKCIAQLDPSRLTAYFETALAGLLNALEQDAQARVMEIDVLPVSERDELLEKFNATTEEFPRDLLIHQLFEARATQQPEAIAVIAEDECLSYAELNQQANRLAHRLRSLGVKPDVPVALCMERSLDMVVCILAVNKAGGAYVPIDPEYPRERIAYMLSNANARLLLKQTHLLQGISFEDVTVVDIDGADTRQQLEGCDDGNIDPRKIGLEASHLCYVIYTSGSTGRPKGVMIEHEALLNRIHWMQKRYRLTIEDCVLQKTPYSFDVSVWEFWWTLTEGAKLVMAKPGGHRDPAYLQAIIQVHDVTTLHFVPSMLASMLTHARWDACTSVRQVFCSGEALPRNLVADFWASGTQSELHNLYGPTEAAIDVTSWDCRGYDDAEVIPIGKPIDNIQIYMLDALGQPVPKGVAGELHIAGVGLARGYIGNAGLTDEKFVTVSLRNGDALIRLYKTGDLARWNEQGDIEYLGRIDNQVKLNGLRIELGEIEARLARHEAVREVVVMARSLDYQSTEDRQLVAYVVPQLGQQFSVSGEETDVIAARKASYRAFLREALPEYMVPTVFIELENLPTTHNGKLDRKSLPAPTAMDIGRQAYAPPRNHWEVSLCAIYQEVLGLERIGIHDNYFELGGNSLGTVQIVSAARQQGMPLTVGQVFKYPTVARLAELLTALTEQAAATLPEKEVLGLDHGAMHDQQEVIS